MPDTVAFPMIFAPPDETVSNPAEVMVPVPDVEIFPLVVKLSPAVVGGLSAPACCEIPLRSPKPSAQWLSHACVPAVDSAATPRMCVSK